MSKITIIGGGSVHWMPTIVRDLAVTPGLSRSHIVLEDIEPQHLDCTLPMARRILSEAGTGCTLEATTDQRAALDGADYVILTISTGGLDAMRHDLEIPEKYGLFQSVGDTVGPGGISRALRNIPVVVGIARDMEQLCPDAWLLNYTNPLSALCRCVTRTTGIRVIGLCHEIHGCFRLLRDIFDVETNDRFDWRVAGVNHLIFLLELRLEFEIAVEMLLDSALALPDHHQNIADARCHGLLDHVLDRRRVHDRQHLFRLRFRGRKEPGPKTGGGNDGLANHSLAFPFPETIFGLMSLT